MRCERYGCASAGGGWRGRWLARAVVGAGGGWRGRCGWVVAGQEVVLQGVGRLAALRRVVPCCWWCVLGGALAGFGLPGGKRRRTRRAHGGGRMRWCSRWFLGLPRGKEKGGRGWASAAGRTVYPGVRMASGTEEEEESCRRWDVLAALRGGCSLAAGGAAGGASGGRRSGSRGVVIAVCSDCRVMSCRCVGERARGGGQGWGGVSRARCATGVYQRGECGRRCQGLVVCWG